MYRMVVINLMPEEPESWEEHYFGVHVPLAAKFPNLRRLTVNKISQIIAGDDSYYTVAELDWDSKEAMLEDLKSPQGKASSEDSAQHPNKRIIFAYEVKEYPIQRR